MQEIVDKINSDMLSTIIEDIEQIRKTDNVSYIDAIADYCDRRNYDIEALGKKLSRDETIRARIQMEAEDANLLERTSRLPV